jgi:hypothetical protein
MWLLGASSAVATPLVATRFTHCGLQWTCSRRYRAFMRCVVYWWHLKFKHNLCSLLHLQARLAVTPAPWSACMMVWVERTLLFPVSSTYRQGLLSSLRTAVRSVLPGCTLMVGCVGLSRQLDIMERAPGSVRLWKMDICVHAHCFVCACLNKRVWMLCVIACICARPYAYMQSRAALW